MTGAFLTTVGGAYTARAVNFDGSTYLSKASDLIGNSNRKVIFGCGWLKPNLIGTQRIYQSVTSSVNYVDINVETSGQLNIFARNSAGTEILDANFAGMFTANTWGLFAFCIDLADTGNLSGRNSAGSVSGTYGTYTNDTIKFSNNDHSMFATTTGGAIYNGDAADVIIQPLTTYIDVNDSAVVARLIRNSKPVDPSSNGSYPTGTTPTIYTGLRGAELAATYGTNKGTGGGFTTTGTITEAGTSPSD